jgi:DNA-binding MarR family transcriptional regulator/GNAT superfamily N-acetyltransferase
MVHQTAPSAVSAEQVTAMRRFNRFYTRQIGVLQEALLESEFSLTEARVLYELNERGRTTATDLAGHLDLDAGYLSRLLRKLETQRLIARKALPADARQSEIALTSKGKRAFAELDTRSHEQIVGLLSALERREQGELLRAMSTIEKLLSREETVETPYLIRPPQPGDFGWVVHRQGALYTSEYGWNEKFEGVVARVVGDFVRDFRPGRDSCWIAESEGEILGSIFVVQVDDATAQLRLLYVEPRARGRGVGSRLVKECLRFAERAGYERVRLWTNDVLTSARRIYEAAGFQITETERHNLFGPSTVGETWELQLDSPSWRTA